MRAQADLRDDFTSQFLTPVRDAAGAYAISVEVVSAWIVRSTEAGHVYAARIRAFDANGVLEEREVTFAPPHDFAGLVAPTLSQIDGARQKGSGAQREAQYLIDRLQALRGALYDRSDYGPEVAAIVEAARPGLGTMWRALMALADPD